MEIYKRFPQKLDYDPYDEDVCGSHDGEVIEILCNDDITIHIQQTDSGIGSSWRVTATHPQMPKPNTELYTFVGDDGEFVVGTETK